MFSMIVATSRRNPNSVNSGTTLGAAVGAGLNVGAELTDGAAVGFASSDDDGDGFFLSAYCGCA